jgi:hypothetical protein
VRRIGDWIWPESEVWMREHRSRIYQQADHLLEIEFSLFRVLIRKSLSLKSPP